VDLLVILKEVANPREAAIAIAVELAEFKVPQDIKVVSGSDHVPPATTLLNTIHQEGLAVFDQHAVPR
jgi:hypothetical protein